MTAVKQSRSRACGGFPPPSLSSASTPLPPAGSSVPMVARGRGLSHTDREVSLRVRHVVAQQKGRKVGEMVILGFTQTSLRTLAKVCLNPVPAPFTAEQAKWCRRSVSVRRQQQPSQQQAVQPRTALGTHAACRWPSTPPPPRRGEARRRRWRTGQTRPALPCCCCMPAVCVCCLDTQAGGQAGRRSSPPAPPCLRRDGCPNGISPRQSSIASNKTHKNTIHTHTPSPAIAEQRLILIFLVVIITLCPSRWTSAPVNNRLASFRLARACACPANVGARNTCALAPSARRAELASPLASTPPGGFAEKAKQQTKTNSVPNLRDF